jgi:uncharacterized protein YbjT (DUF2867 family)
MYVVVGATGNTGSIVTKTLLSQGKKVRAIGRNAERLNSLGAEPFVGDITDAESMKRAFAGCEAAYLMIAPDMANPDFPGYQKKATEALTAAVESSRIKHVVLLSSLGADKPSGTGPIAGLHSFEERLKRISDLNALFLRPGYFMENTLPQVGAIKQMGAAAGPVKAELKIPMIATRDIGQYAADALSELGFRGHKTQELLGQRDISYAEVTAIIGNAIGKPDLQYRQMTSEQFAALFMQMGASKSMADGLMEMTEAMNANQIRALEARSASNSTPTSFEQFVTDIFAPAYRAAAAEA